MNIQGFVFSWKGQYQNAIDLESQLKKLVDTIVINSDDTLVNSEDISDWIHLDDSCYFSDQFKKALELFDDTKYDALCHIQADVSSDSWKEILESAQETYEKYQWGIYAPNVVDSFYVPVNTDVFDLEDKIRVVATPDCSAWIIHKDFIQEMKKNLFLMENNKFGWGWDLIISGLSHLKHRPVIRDYRFTVNHPPSTGYKKNDAEQEMIKMIRSCPTMLQEIIVMIKTNHRNIAELYGVDNREPEEENVFVYDTTR